MAVISHPYKDRPSYCYWRRIHDVDSISEVDPVTDVLFKLDIDDKVMTAGSCFAQHIARNLKAHGYNFLVTEDAHPIIPSEIAYEFNYGVFTARYGNLYTARQLLQLFKRVYGLFTPCDNEWVEPNGRYIDPFRPTIQPGGFSGREEFIADRERHFTAVRKGFEEANIFVFTFGLTEAFFHKADGAVYPLCPGVSGGAYDPNLHEFKNFTASEIVADFLEFVDLLREKNPSVNIIMTVSPVPLIATAENRSVIVSTSYSKAALRVACDEIQKARPKVAYFPSYEIVTGNFARGRYFGPDLRDVTEDGVSHVMSVFMRHYTDGFVSKQKVRPDARSERDRARMLLEEVERGLNVICDEELLDARKRA